MKKENLEILGRMIMASRTLKPFTYVQITSTPDGHEMSKVIIVEFDNNVTPHMELAIGDAIRLRDALNEIIPQAQNIGIVLKDETGD